MITFKEWLGLDDGFMEAFVPIHQRASYTRDVRAGREAEDLISQRIGDCGWKTRPSSSMDDMRRGIDVYLLDNGKWVGAQIKRRTTDGQDIGYEVASTRWKQQTSARNLPAWQTRGQDQQSLMNQNLNQPPDPRTLLQSLNGRDMNTQSVYTIIQNAYDDKIIRIRTQDGKNLIRSAVAAWLGELKAGQSRSTREFTDGKVVLKVTWDKRDGYWKCMGFVHPTALPIEQCQKAVQKTQQVPQKVV